MTTATETKPRRITWEDWAGDDPRPDDKDLVTKEDILTWLAEKGFEVTVREFHYLQTLDIIPRPILRKRNGVRVGLYPDWVCMQALNAIALHRDHGYPFETIRRHLRSPDRRNVVFKATKPVPSIVYAAVNELATWETEHTGREPARVEIVLVDAEGRRVSSLNISVPAEERRGNNLHMTIPSNMHVKSQKTS